MKTLAQRLKALAASREPDFVIRHSGVVYLQRWWLIPRNRFFNIYLHKFTGDDEDRALHDHPWFNLSILLEGAYIEHTIKRGGIHASRSRQAGAWKFRSPWAAHRLSLIVNPTWTLFITGPVVRTWGFHCPNGWRNWRDFVDERDSGQIGRGCRMTANPAPAPDGWLPMSHAPMDGRRISIAVRRSDHGKRYYFHEVPYLVRWHGGRWCYARNNAPLFDWHKPVRWKGEG